MTLSGLAAGRHRTRHHNSFLYFNKQARRQQHGAQKPRALRHQSILRKHRSHVNIRWPRAPLWLGKRRSAQQASEQQAFRPASVHARKLRSKCCGSFPLP